MRSQTRSPSYEIISVGDKGPAEWTPGDADYVVFVDAGAKLSNVFGEILALARDADVVYADESDPELPSGDAIVRKPGPSPERLRCQYFWGSVVAYRTAFLEELGGFHAELGSVALYDLALRATRSGGDVRHIAEVVASKAGGPSLGKLRPEEVELARSVLEEHLAQTGGGRVTAIGLDGVHETRRPINGSPLVSLVIPTTGRWSAGVEHHSYLLDAVRSIVERTTYESYELVVVHDDADPDVIAELEGIAVDRLRLVPWTRTFNFSGKINLGALHARGEYLLILNDDVELITPDWIESMLRLAQLPSAGAVGCMLYYEDGSIQHAGHHYWRGDAKHIGMTAPSGSPGPLSGFRVEREVVGITAACAMIERELYLRVGGMTELLPSAFNDVDLCMKLNAAGRVSYWTPAAELFHFESKSRDPSVRRWEIDVAWGRWGSKMHAPEFWPYPD